MWDETGTDLKKPRDIYIALKVIGATYFLYQDSHLDDTYSKL